MIGIEIQLSTLPNPAAPTVGVEFFRSTETAWRHVCDHMLTMPECQGWALVANHFTSILDPSDFVTRRNCAATGVIGGRPIAQGLYDLYHAAVSRDAGDAALLGWYHQAKGIVVSFGTSGILIVIDKYVRTAFLAGAGSAEAVNHGREQPKHKGLRRERGMRGGRMKPDESERERRLRERRETSWGPDKRLYYLVFRPAVRFLRESCDASRNMLGEPITHYHMVKEFLPPQSRLDLQTWQELRRQCGREERHDD